MKFMYIFLYISCFYIEEIIIVWNDRLWIFFSSGVEIVLLIVVLDEIFDDVILNKKNIS